MIRLHSHGLGTKRKQAELISPDEEALLWSTGQLGFGTAQSILNTITARYLDYGAMMSTALSSVDSWKRK